MEAHAAESLGMQFLQLVDRRGGGQQRDAAVVAIGGEQIRRGRVIEVMHRRLHDHAALDAKVLMQRKERLLRRIGRRRVAALGGEWKARPGAEDVEMGVARTLW